MHSFILTLGTALLFGAISSAVPVTTPPVVRAAAPRGISAIVTEAQSKIAPLAQQIANANSGNATTATFTPISNQIQSILSNALSEVKSLKGQPQDVILANADGTGQLTVPQLATQVDGLVTTVVSPLSNVQSLDLLSGGDLLTVLNSVIDLVGSLLTAIISDVAGIILALVPGLDSLIPLLRELNLTSILSALGL